MKDRRDFNCKCGYAFKQGDNGECKRCEEKEAFEKATGTDHESYMKANQQKREAEAREDKGSSTQAKLKAIVEKMVERGWKPNMPCWDSWKLESITKEPRIIFPPRPPMQFRSNGGVVW
jgi:hypothetical protein